LISGGKDLKNDVFKQLVVIAKKEEVLKNDTMQQNSDFSANFVTQEMGKEVESDLYIGMI